MHHPLMAGSPFNPAFFISILKEKRFILANEPLVGKLDLLNVDDRIGLDLETLC